MVLRTRSLQDALTPLKEDSSQQEVMELARCGTFPTDSALPNYFPKIQVKKQIGKLQPLSASMIQICQRMTKWMKWPTSSLLGGTERSISGKMKKKRKLSLTRFFHKMIRLLVIKTISCQLFMEVFQIIWFTLELTMVHSLPGISKLELVNTCSLITTQNAQAKTTCHPSKNLNPSINFQYLTADLIQPKRNFCQ